MIECLEILRSWAGDARFVCRAESGTEHHHDGQYDYIEPLPEGAQVSEPDALGSVWLLQSILEVYHTSGTIHVVTYQEAHRRYVPDTARPIGQSVDSEVALDIANMIALTERFDECRFTGLEVEPVRASVHTDDFACECDFDATPWLEQAKDSEIIALARIDFGGDYPADVVAMFFDGYDRDSNVAVGLLFRYVETSGQGFECYVNGGDTIRWLRDNRPYLIGLIEEVRL